MSTVIGNGVFINVSQSGGGDCYYRLRLYNYSGSSLIGTVYVHTGDSFTIAAGYAIEANGAIKGTIVQNITQNKDLYLNYSAVEYHESESGNLGVLVFSNYIVWFFMGYTKSADDIPKASIDQEVRDYVPSVTMLAKSYTDDSSETTNGWIGFHNNSIRSWNISASVTIAGTFWGVLDVPAQVNTPRNSDTVEIMPYVNYHDYTPNY